MKKKHCKAIELKYLDDETIMKIRDWRNQGFVREVSVNQHIITEEEHLKFIDMVRNDKNRGLFVYYLDDVPFGVSQYTYCPEKDVVTNGNYLIDEEYQYLGYGLILIYFVNVINFEYMGFGNQYGEALTTNSRLTTMAKKMGAELKEKRLLDDGAREVYILRENASDWETRKYRYEKIVFKIVEEQFDVIY